MVPRAKEEGKPARGTKDKAKTVDDLKQEIEMVLLLEPNYLLILLQHCILHFGYQSVAIFTIAPYF